MSGNNNVPQQIITDEEGKIVARITELDVARQGFEEYRGWLNGTEGNWTEVSLTRDWPPRRDKALIDSLPRLYYAQKV
jgi:hypothetical protein